MTFTGRTHGAAGLKPTSVLAPQIPTLRNYVFQRQDGKAEEKQVRQAPLIGKDSSGRFRTAQAKEYTPSLNKTFAMAMIDNLKRHHSGVEAAAENAVEAEWRQQYARW